MYSLTWKIEKLIIRWKLFWMQGYLFIFRIFRITFPISWDFFPYRYITLLDQVLNQSIAIVYSGLCPFSVSCNELYSTISYTYILCRYYNVNCGSYNFPTGWNICGWVGMALVLDPLYIEGGTERNEGGWEDAKKMVNSLS